MKMFGFPFQDTISAASVTVENNVITCEFTRMPNLEGDDSFYNISGDNAYFILLAIGDNIGSNGKFFCTRSEILRS